MNQEKINNYHDLAKQNCKDPRLTHIWELWLKLSAAKFKVEEGKSLFERLAIKPWETNDPLISKAWQELTAPENLKELEYWNNQGTMNPIAQEVTDKAIEYCKKRNKS